MSKKKKSSIESLFEEAVESVERIENKASEKDEENPEIVVELSDQGESEPIKEKAVEKPQTESGKSGASRDPDELYDRLIRVMADFDNFRKRSVKERQDLLRYGNEGLARAILPVLDNFERALEHSRKTQDVEAIRQGVEMIYQQFRTILESFGVRPVESLGKPFDPMIHEAMSQIPSKEYPPNTVIEVHHQAFNLHDRLLRPALVTVSKEVSDGVTEEVRSSDSESGKEERA